MKKTQQKTLDFSSSLTTRSSSGWTPFLYTRLSPAIPTKVFATYWTFAHERQEIFFRRALGQGRPWTEDPILERHKFTNAYRASDRVSQYLIRNVIYRPDLPDSTNEVFFRTLLFKLFNRIDTWRELEARLGPITWSSYRFQDYDRALTDLRSSGRRIYSAAYIMPPGGSTFGSTIKHQNHLRLLEMLMKNDAPRRIEDCQSMKEAFSVLRACPTFGDFLAYQLVTDLNYGALTSFSESEFVIAGPGARDGIRKCFSDPGGYSERELVAIMMDNQEREFERHGLKFRDLWGRPLQLIDCQNLFCEVDKYAREAHPEILGISGRTRIKQKFSPQGGQQLLWYPPKWSLNHRIPPSIRNEK